MNERYIEVVAKAALEDLVTARETYGKTSPEHKEQTKRSCMFIEGSLEEVLIAAIPNLERLSRDTQCQTTQTG